MRQVIHGEIYSEDFNKLNKLIAGWCSCYRFSFCRFQKGDGFQSRAKGEGLKFNEVRNLAKEKYKSLNTRQVSDAVMQARTLFSRVGGRKVVFGGRTYWDKLISGEISREQWRDRRDNQIYARGDKTKKGNPNIRLVDKGGNLWIRVTVGNKRFENYKLFIPTKFKERLLTLLVSCKLYNVRLLKKGPQHCRVIIDYEVKDPGEVIDFSNGAIGVDVNPDRVAVSDVGSSGNLVRSFTTVNNRMLFASTSKRNYEIACIVKQIINYASKTKKGIVFENLRFKKQFENRGRKFNRKKSNFVWKKIVTLLERKCIENGIMHKKVNPAFTSVIGKLKYQRMFNLSVHQSASYVVGRRGLGFNEKLSLYKYPSRLVKELVLDLVGDGTKRLHSWSLWRKLRDKEDAVLTALQSRLQSLEEDCGVSAVLVGEAGNLCYGGGNPSGGIPCP